MKNVVLFLQAITNKLPSCPQNHNLTLNSEGKLRITIFYEDKWYGFDFNEEDLEKDPEELATEVHHMFQSHYLAKTTEY